VSTVHIFPRDSERAAIFGLRGQWSSGSPGVYWLMEELSESLAHTASANSQRRTVNANVWEEHKHDALCSCVLAPEAMGIYLGLLSGFPPMPMRRLGIDTMGERRCRGGYGDMTRILIADDHEVVRSGLRCILETQPKWEVVAEASDGNEAVSKAFATSPDVAMLDYSMPIINGIEATRQIRKRLPRTEVLIFTMHQSEALIKEVVQAGALGYLLKSDAKRHLIGALDAVARHKPFFTASISDATDSFLRKPDQLRSILTSRERHVVQLIAEGHTNKQIAHALKISPKTVETHRATVMRKLTLSSSASLVRYAVRNGMLHA
jgi:DNA-binding NarL/FixJ family response regulator